VAFEKAGLKMATARVDVTKKVANHQSVAALGEESLAGSNIAVKDKARKARRTSPILGGSKLIFA